jgi:CHAD domain-containing protein
MRVGLRRLRTAFRLFEEVVKDGEARRLGDEVKWLADELGAARNLDVYLQDVFVPEALSDEGVARRYGDRLQRSRKAAYAKADAAVRSPRFARLMLDLAVWLEDGAWRSPKDDAPRATALAAPIPDFAARVLENLRRTVKKRGKDLAKLDPEHRHKLRIRCKRLRYASEFFAHAFDGGRKRREAFADALKGLQDALGLLNDMAQAQATAAQTLGKGAPQAMSFAAGELVGRLRARRGKSMDKAQDGYRTLMKAGRFWPKPEPDAPPTPAWMLAPD